MATDNIPERTRAAQYVRMSTDYQQYSTKNQYAKISEYAIERNIQIVSTYADEGKSGLSIGDRSALKKLISDVTTNKVDFQSILVYDISRWGRFQDADESAYYEYICRRAGIAVVYCAEQFENDGSPISTIVKGVKRAMAGEYSRELSTKVFIGQCRLVEKGFRQGGSAGLGLRRVLIDQGGKIKGELKFGEQKSIQTDRVILMPAPREEVQIVNDMYTWLIRDNFTVGQIAERLNSLGILSDRNKQWTYRSVHEVLTNDKYIGNNTFNRQSFKLKKIRIKNSSDIMVCKQGAFLGIVPIDIFSTAQNVLKRRASHITNEEMLEQLRSLLVRKGHLSRIVIDQTPEVPNTTTYVKRFGSLRRAFELCGFQIPRDMSYFEINKRIQQLQINISNRIQSTIISIGGEVWEDPETNVLRLNSALSIRLVVLRCHIMRNGLSRWYIRPMSEKYAADILVAVRMNSSNTKEIDYYIIPKRYSSEHKMVITEHDCGEYECFRFDRLDFLYDLIRSEKLKK